ncbi:hypothetical protein LEM8419_02782 [Neolewinella maritima]|uniref:Tetratricopeptide repeat protein n=1 Tax=Neolewinella maritima TaxID=1383882 RepID=A0ABN8FCB4_9BACT|nr:hypothetical protein [Neolewinella maritima]CAH1001874.1 hypothetical protein LEM8419_02782 [Neolewinella maritima]
MLRLLLLLLSLLLCPAGPYSLHAQSHESLALAAYLRSDLSQWDEALAASASIPDPETRLLTQAEYQLGKAYAAMAGEDESARDAAMEAMDDMLDQIWELTETNATAHGLYAALLGLKIARTPMTGMIHGSRASRYVSKGVALGPDNPAALYHAAGNLYYTPEQWGGDPEQALRYLQRAISLYGPDRNQNYRYLAALALLGQVQAKLDQTDAARATYRMALEAQPEFHYVSKLLLPRLGVE